MDAAEFRAFALPVQAVQQLCERHGLPAVRGVERIHKGEVSASFRIDLADDTRAVLKVYCRSQDPQWLERDAASLDYLRRVGEVPGPRWTRLDVSGVDVPFPCLLLDHIDGVDGDEAPLGDRTRTILLFRRCGATLAALHRTPLDHVEEVQRQGLYPASVWAERTASQFVTAMANLREQGWIDPVLLAACDEAFEQEQEALWAPFEPVFLHRDYQLWNIRVDPETLAIRGLLDFDAAGLGPAEADVRDLEINHFLDHPGLRREFWTGYGRPQPVGRPAARLRVSALVRALSLLAAYWGPCQQVTSATVWRLLSPWSEDMDVLCGE